jgi:hypothetical protein
MPSPAPAGFACALVLMLAGCFGTQIYPTLQEYRISLDKGDLEAAGVAFTPSAVTGQEEEKQAAVTEKAVTLRTLVEYTAEKLIARLP